MSENDTSRLDQLDARLNQIVDALSANAKREQDREKSDKLRSIDETETQIERLIAGQKATVDKARATLLSANEEGDVVKMTEAQAALAEAIAKRERMEAEAVNVRRNLKAERDRGAAPATGSADDQQVSTENRDKWLQDNSWYGVDDELTAAAKQADVEVQKLNAFAPGSKEYYTALTNKVRARFPDRFEGSPGGFSTTKGAPASGGGSAAAGGVRIDHGIAESWRKLGFDVDDPKVVANLVEQQKKLRAKGILPQEPTRDLRVLVR